MTSQTDSCPAATDLRLLEFEAADGGQKVPATVEVRLPLVAPFAPDQGGVTVQRRSTFSLGRIVERMAELAAPQHRELVRGMASELDVIADPADRRRFAAGAIIAIVRLALFGYR